MKNELVVIEEKNALAVLSNADGVDKLVEEVRERVMSLEGGSLETGVGRKQIKSNAFKATKAKTAINEQHIQPLIDRITKKIQPDLDTIDALKENRKRLNAGLDQIRKDVNEEVQAIENEIKRKKEEEEARIAAEKLREEVERDHEFALLMNAEFDRKAEEERIAAEQAEKERLAKEAQERAEREARIAQEAKEKAEREAAEREEKLRREAEEAKAKAEAERLAAIERERKAELDRIAAEERAKAQAEEAERQRVIAEEKAKRDAEEAAERARQAEIQRQQEEAERQRKEQEEKAAKVEHARSIHQDMKQAFILAGLDDASAELAVKALVNKSIPHIGSVIY